MKRIWIPIVVLILLSVAATTVANAARIVTSSDVTTYGDAINAEGHDCPDFQEGDVIFFTTDKNRNGQIYNTTDWIAAGARLGATIWIEAGTYDGIDIRGNATSETLDSDADHPNHITSWGGQLIIDRTNEGFGGRDFELINFKYLHVHFETNDYPGARDGWHGGMHGTFGLLQKETLKNKNIMSIVIDNGLGSLKGISINGLELTEGAFAGIRAFLDGNSLDYFITRRCFITDKFSEGSYTGSTQGGSTLPILSNFIFEDNLVCFAGSELFQGQQLGNGSRIRNNVWFVGDTFYQHNFQAYQDTGIQLSLAQGDVIFENNIIVSSKALCIQLFSQDLSNGNDPDVEFGDGIVTIRNNLSWKPFNLSFVRAHNSYIHPIRTEISNNYVVDPVGRYTDVGADAPYLFDIDETASEIQIIGGHYPAGSTVLNAAKSNINVHYDSLTFDADEAPEFVNSGFDDIDVSRITAWGEMYLGGKFFGTSSTSIHLSTLGSSQLFTIQAGKSFANGQHVKVYSRAHPTEYFYADVKSYSGTALGLNNVSGIVGRGTHTDWRIGKLIPYTTDDFVRLLVNGEDVPLKMYKCARAHNSTLTTRPDTDDGTHWTLVQWDAQGKNQYDDDYDGIPVTDNVFDVAGDMRLVKGSTYQLLGMGLKSND